MTVSHIDADSFEGWSLADPIEKAPVTDMLPEWVQPFLTTPDKWENYSSDVVYQTDKRIRNWIDIMKKTWSKSGVDRRYTFKQLSEILGLEEVIEVRKNYNIVARIFAYYSTRIQKDTFVRGKRAKRVYTISARRLSKPPYSLKLRLEQLEKEGTWRDFVLPKDDLEMGHARYPRTEANMQKRSKEARSRANAVLREWRESHNTGKSRTDS